MKLLILPQTNGITQVDLENILTVLHLKTKYHADYERIAAGVLKRLSIGVEVEPGPRSVEIKETYSGGRRVETLRVW